MNAQNNLGGTFHVSRNLNPVRRMGYGAMQLAGAHVSVPIKITGSMIYNRSRQPRENANAASNL